MYKIVYGKKTEIINGIKPTVLWYWHTNEPMNFRVLADETLGSGY